MRLIGKCLQVGVLEGVELSTSESGTAQGSVLSPLLGTVYLHCVLDLWFDREVKPRLRGGAPRANSEPVLGHPPWVGRRCAPTTFPRQQRAGKPD